MTGQTAYELDLLKKTTENVIRSLTDHKVLKGWKGNLVSFLQDRRHFFYHQCYQDDADVCCCCPKDGRNIPIRDVMPKQSFKALYRSNGNLKKGHRIKQDDKIIQECIHKYQARNVTLDDIDIDTLIYIILNCGFRYVSESKKKSLETIRTSIPLINYVIHNNRLQDNLSINRVYEAMLNITYSKYYRNIIKMLLGNKIQCLEIVLKKENESPAHVSNTDEMTTKNDGNDNVKLFDPNLRWKNRVETRSKQKRIGNLSLYVEFDVLRKANEADKTMVKRDIATENPKVYMIELKIATIKQWKIDRIIRKLNQNTERLTNGLGIDICKISKGSVDVQAIIDEDILSNEGNWSELLERFMSRIVTCGEIPTRVKHEIPVTAKIVEPVTTNDSWGILLEMERHFVVESSDRPISIGSALNKNFGMLLPYPVVARRGVHGHIYVDPIVDKRLEYNLPELTNHLLDIRKCFERFDFTNMEALLDHFIKCSPYRSLEVAMALYGTENWNDTFCRLVTHMINDYIKESAHSKISFECICRFLLSGMNSTDEEVIIRLHKCLILANSLHERQIAKAIAWKLVRIFVKKNPALNFHDIWPGIECNCTSNKRKVESNDKYCNSDRVVIFVEIRFGQRIPDKKDFCGISLRYQSTKCMSKEAKMINQHLNEATSSAPDISIIKGISSDEANILFSSHRNLTLISKSPLKSIKFKDERQKFLNKPCIQLYCRVKGIIPIGEPHFPTYINSYPTDVMEGYPQLLVRDISIGNEVGILNGSTGTLGGFLKYRGEDAFLTCAHVIFERKHLAPGADLTFIDEQKITVLCKGNNEDIFPCGTLADHRFPPNTSNDGVSIDAAVVKLLDCCKIQDVGLKEKYLNHSVLDYRELGTNTDIETFAVGYVSSVQNKNDSVTIPDNPFRAKFEELYTLVERVGQQIPNNGLTDAEHLRVVMNEVEENERQLPRQVELYNQISFRNINFKQGDSGMCIYAKDKKGREGCVGMAIASHPGGGCIVTPMKSILSSLNVSCKSPEA